MAKNKNSNTWWYTTEVDEMDTEPIEIHRVMNCLQRHRVNDIPLRFSGNVIYNDDVACVVGTYYTLYILFKP